MAQKGPKSRRGPYLSPKAEANLFRDYGLSFLRQGLICFLSFSQIFSGNLFHAFSPTVLAFASAGNALQALGAAERAGDEAPKHTKASVTVTKGGNRKGIPLTRDFFAVVFSFTGFGFLWARFL